MTISPPRQSGTPALDGRSPGKEPWFARMARFSGTHRRAVMAIWLLVTLVAAPLALTLTGGRAWYTLRREHGLSASETHRAIEEQLEALLAR